MPTLLQPGSIDFASIVRSGDTVMWGQANAEPLPLTQALVAQRHDIGTFRVFLGVSSTDTCRPEHADCIDFVSYCGTGANRALARAGALDVLPCHYSQFPQMIRAGQLKVDVLLLQLAPPDAEGRYSVCYLRDDDPDFILPSSRAPLENPPATTGTIELAIAGHVAGLIDDGATLQFGLGAIPEAVLASLSDRRDLGVHSGAIGDKVAELMEAGVINNLRKSIDPGVSVAGVMMGSRRIHDFAHRNRAVQFRSTTYTHDPDVLARIDRFVALNSALEVDLSGQINAEVAGGSYGGGGGGGRRLRRWGRRCARLPARRAARPWRPAGGCSAVDRSQRRQPHRRDA